MNFKWQSQVFNNITVHKCAQCGYKFGSENVKHERTKEEMINLINNMDDKIIEKMKSHETLCDPEYKYF